MKKIAPIILALLLLVSSFIIPISAEDSVAFDPANVGFSRNKIVIRAGVSSLPDLKDFAEGDYEITDTWKITDEAGMIKLSELVEATYNFEGKSIYLANDIDMTDSDFKPIGEHQLKETFGADIGIDSGTCTTPTRFFAGTFDGQGYIIDNLKFDSANESLRITREDKPGKYAYIVGIFKVVWGAKLKNVIVGEGCEYTNSTNSPNSMAGGLVGYIWAETSSTRKTEIFNVYSLAKIGNSSIGFTNAGGIVGRIQPFINEAPDYKIYAEITHTTNEGSVYSGNCAGGFIGWVQALTKIENCRNKGNISSTSFAAGFVPRQRGAYINNCINNGKISTTHASNAVGGIMAYCQDNNWQEVIKVTNCYNYGEIVGTNKHQIIVDGHKGTVNNNHELYGQPDPTLTYVKVVGVQSSPVDGGEYSLRFVGLIEGMENYTRVGFEVIAKYMDGGTEKIDTYSDRYSNVVFKKLLGTDNGITTTYKTTHWGDADSYMYAIVFDGIPAGKGRIEFTVTALYKNSDGTALRGNSAALVFDAGNHVG